MTETVLSAEGLSKSYSGVQALAEVSMEVRPREVVGLIGENGAGKSTLLKIIAGLQRPDRGQILVRGKKIPLGSLNAASEAGIGMVFQEQSLLPNISVAENILLGHESSGVRFGVYDWKRLHALSAVQLAKIGAHISPSAPTDSLSFAERQLVEFAKVLCLEERTRHEPVILLDEPTSVLDADELEIVLTQVERLKQRASVVFVSHRLEEVLRVSDRIYVMTNGRCVAERDPKHCHIAELQLLMLGKELSSEYVRDSSGRTASSSPGRSRLRVADLGLGDAFESISFDLAAGEVLGIAGVEGSGREKLCRALFGAEKPTRGEVLLDDSPVAFASPAEAVAAGIGYVPAERRVEGIVAGLSVLDNITLAHSKVVQRGPFVDGKRARELVGTWIERLGIKTPSADTLAGNLSGGNQQKVVLAKWLIGTSTRVLILDHPMRGLDVGAKAEIFALIRGLAERGIGIILIADTLDELIALSSVIIVMRDGRISGRFDCSETVPTRLQVLERMV